MDWENDSGEDSDAVDQTELEVALYSQIHFDPVSTSDLPGHLTYNTPWLASPHGGSRAKQGITVSEDFLSSGISKSKGESKATRKQSVQSRAGGKENNQSQSDDIEASEKTELDLLISKRDSFIKLLNKLPEEGKKKKKTGEETAFSKEDSFIKLTSKSPIEIKKKPKSSSTPKLKKAKKPKTVSVTYNKDSDTDCSDDVEEYLSILEKTSNKEPTAVDVRAKHTKSEDKEPIKLVISDSDDIITINNVTGDESLILINDESFITIDETFSKSGSLEKNDTVQLLSDGEDVVTILDESGKSRSKPNKDIDKDNCNEEDDDSSVDIELNYDGIEISDEESININTEVMESSEDETELETGKDEADLESGEDEAELESGEDEAELESGEDEAELESGEDEAELESGEDEAELESGEDEAELVSSGENEESEPNSSSDDSSEEDMNLEEMAAKPDLSLQFNLFEDGKTLLKPGPDDAEKAKWKINDEDHYKVTSTMNRYFAPKSIQCRNCKEHGHMSRDCPEPMKRRCAFCAEEGHPHQACPGAFCFKCNGPGHRVKDCTNPRQNTRDPCPRCWVTGHKDNMCPDLWRQCRTSVTAGITGVVTGEKRAASVNYCYNCGGRGHLGYECKETRMSHFIPACFPFVAQFDEGDKRLYTALGWRDLIKDKGRRIAHEPKSSKDRNNSSRDEGRKDEGRKDEGRKDRKRGKRGGERVKEKEKRSKERQSQRASLGDGEDFPRNKKYMKPDAFLNSMDDFHGRGKVSQNDKSYYEEELEEYLGHQVSNNEYWNKEKKKNKKKKESRSDSRTPKKITEIFNSQPDTSEEFSQRPPRTQNTSFEYIDNSSYDQSYSHSPSKKQRTHENYSGDFRVNRTVENDMFGNRRNKHNTSFNDTNNRSFDQGNRSFDQGNRSFDQGDRSFDDGDKSFSNRSFKNRGNSYKNRDNREREFMKKNSGIGSYQNPQQMKHSKSFPELKRHETKQNKSGFQSRNSDFMHMADKCKQNFRNQRY